MSKTRSLAICALISSTVILGACSVVAQPTTAGADTSQAPAVESAPKPGKSSAVVVAAAQQDTGSAPAGGSPSETAPSASRGYMATTPADTVVATRLIGTRVKTFKDETVGSVSDLIIDGHGQIVAIVVGVGGVLGMGEKIVAIGWDDVKRSGPAGAQELRIDVNQEDLRSAPTFKQQK